MRGNFRGHLTVGPAGMLNRRKFLAMAGAAPMVGHGSGPPAILGAHFPNRMCQFVWRNWGLANIERMALVLGTGAGNVLRVGAAMGPPPG